MVIPYCTVSKLAFATRGVCPAKPELLANVWLTVIQTPTDTHMGTHTLMLTISFPTTPPLGFVFHGRMIMMDYGFNISGFFGSLQCYIVCQALICHSTDAI